MDESPIMAMMQQLALIEQAPEAARDQMYDGLAAMLADATAAFGLKLAPLRENMPSGREVVDLRVQEVLADESISKAVVGAFNEHGALLFRGQSLSPAEEEAFAKLFPWDDSVSVAEHSGPYDSGQSSGDLLVWNNRCTYCRDHAGSDGTHTHSVLFREQVTRRTTTVDPTDPRPDGPAPGSGL